MRGLQTSPGVRAPLEQILPSADIRAAFVLFIVVRLVPLILKTFPLLTVDCTIE